MDAGSESSTPTIRAKADEYAHSALRTFSNALSESIPSFTIDRNTASLLEAQLIKCSENLTQSEQILNSALSELEFAGERLEIIPYCTRMTETHLKNMNLN